jgi:hypothetical protein
MKLPNSILMVEGVEDTRVRNALVSIKSNLHQAFGIGGNKTQRFVTAQDLATAGLASVNDAGVISQRTIPAGSASTSTGSSGARVSVSATVSMSGWQIGDNYISLTIPTYAVIMNGWYYVSTAAESATNAAKIGLGVEVDSVAGLLVSVGVTSGFSVGSHGLIPDGSAASFLAPTTNYRSIVAAVTVENITAGIMTFCLEYFLVQ